VSFDNSRFPFNPENDFCGVVMQQGRVQLDSDWNDWLAQLSRRIQAGTMDVLGRAVYPATTPYAFQITASSAGGTNKLTIGPGRMYVDGLLAENHGAQGSAQWDPALAEMSGSPQPPPASKTGALDYTEQPYMPAGTKLLPGNGPFLVYLDLWIRPVTYLEYPDLLVDKAVGVDATGRLQTAWQVKLFDLANSPGATCNSNISGWPPAPSAGLLTTGIAPTPPSGPCCLTAGAGYTGMENQFYRVEIHQPGIPVAGATPPSSLPGSTATFKWSRENASVMTAVTSIANVQNSEGNPASQLEVQSLGRDQVLGFAPGNWIEILDDDLEFAGQPGELHQIDTVDYAAKTITLATTLTSQFKPGDTDPNVHTRIQRWDQSGKVYEKDGKTVWWDLDTQGGDIPVPPAGTALMLENGIIASFDLDPAITPGSFRTRDFWSFAARTADGSIEILNEARPRGLHHHYAKLSIVTFPNSATNCRTQWPPSAGAGTCGCCTVTVGDGVESVGQFTSIQQAIDSLPAEGGEVCILPGRYFENVFVRGRRDVVLRGCGGHSRIASASLNPQAPGGTASPAAGAAGAASGSGVFAAVIDVAASQHIQMISFAVEAATDEVGILLDGSGKLGATPQTSTGPAAVALEAAVKERQGVVDVALNELVLTASTLPGVLADRVRLLQMQGCRVAMQDVRSQWPAVWVTGAEIRIVRNWVGIQDASTKAQRLPATVAADLSADAGSGTGSGAQMAGTGGLHPGGIQIAGPARDVFVLENEIEGGSRNGITLGRLSLLDAKGKDTGTLIGVLGIAEDPCSTTGSLLIPIEIPGSPGSRLVAGSKLVNIQIDRNRIRNMGLCGIGPVGFFDLLQELEVISIENLTISSNAIARTVLRNLADASQETAATSGYAAICVPDVENLIIRDNSVIDFGSQPGAQACGIFLLHAEMADISGNQVLETRDWGQAAQNAATGAGPRGGIVIVMAMPPSFASPPVLSMWEDAASRSGAGSIPTHQPGLPALRVHDNLVRVPIGEALAAVGLGPFSIRGNEFCCGGTVKLSGRPIASTVLILNMGAAIETAAAAKFSRVLDGSNSAYGTVRGGGFGEPSSGAVLFTSNTCRLEARSSKQQAFSSVAIGSLDCLNFGDNQCWVDGPALTAFVDALLAASTLQLTGNRLQEGAGFPVIASGFTVGFINIAAQNLSTYCLFNRGSLKLIDANNVAIVGLFDDAFCPNLGKKLNL
jgi:hypothetical protein